MTSEKAKSDHLFSKLKNFFKRWPHFYYFLVHFFGGIPINTSAKKFVSQLETGKVIINVGSGPQILRSDVVNIDFAPFPGVNIRASAEALPFGDSSVDVAICDNVLDHVQDPKIVVKELSRVLKRGGLIYVGTPFIIGFHSSPNDYYRWTHEGLKELLCHDFEIREINIQYGPTAGAMYIMCNWFALLLSFNIQALYEFWLLVFMVILAPVKLLDLILARYKFARGIALGFYCIGKKI